MKKLFLVVALVATLIPIIFVIYEVGGWRNWQGVLPRGSTDSLYYYTRMHEVVDGYQAALKQGLSTSIKAVRFHTATGVMYFLVTISPFTGTLLRQGI